MFTDRTAFPGVISVFDLFLVALAARAVIDFWRESSLVSLPRDRLDYRGGRLGELSGCRFCLSYWWCLLLAFLGRWAAAAAPAYLGEPILVGLFALAAASLLHVLFGYLPLAGEAEPSNTGLPPLEPDILPIAEHEDHHSHPA